MTFEYNPVLGTAVADATGTAVLVAAAMPQPGVYTVMASAADGRRASTNVTVVDSAAAPLAPTTASPPIVGGLPKTGSDSTRSFELVLLLLVAGLGLVLVSRRPKRT